MEADKGLYVSIWFQTRLEIVPWKLNNEESDEKQGNREVFQRELREVCDILIVEHLKRCG